MHIYPKFHHFSPILYHIITKFIHLVTIGSLFGYFLVPFSLFLLIVEYLLFVVFRFIIGGFQCFIVKKLSFVN
jgi:hypothetical protein